MKSFIIGSYPARGKQPHPPMADSPQSPKQDPLGIVSKFLMRYLQDREQGRVRSLEAYQALFPGYESAIDQSEKLKSKDRIKP